MFWSRRSNSKSVNEKLLPHLGGIGCIGGAVPPRGGQKGSWSSGFGVPGGFFGRNCSIVFCSSSCTPSCRKNRSALLQFCLARKWIQRKELWYVDVCGMSLLKSPGRLWLDYWFLRCPAFYHFHLVFSLHLTYSSVVLKSKHLGLIQQKE